MRRTYIPKLLRMAEEMRLYLGKNQRSMSEAANLNSEQREILSTLYKALNDLVTKIGIPLFPEQYQPKSRPRAFDPQAEWPDFHALYERQEGRCFYCRRPLMRGPATKAERQRKRHAPEERRAWQIDHALPRARGGKDRMSNYRLCCVECNCHKGLLTEEEYMAVIALRNGGIPFNPSP